MISESWIWNGVGGLLLALIATTAMMEAKSNSLVPKSLLLWPVFVITAGVFNLFQGGRFLGLALLLCGIQAAGTNLRRLAPWPSGAIWLSLVLVGLGMQVGSLFVERVMGFIWAAIGMTKVMRERSASLEGGTPIWISLLYLQAVLLASYR